jgi:hypothetical protein
MNANRAYYPLLRAEIIKMFRTLIRPVETYTAEFWTLDKDISEWLATTEGRVLRRMFGGFKVKENWIKRYSKQCTCLEIQIYFHLQNKLV